MKWFPLSLCLCLFAIGVEAQNKPMAGDAVYNVVPALINGHPPNLPAGTTINGVAPGNFNFIDSLLNTSGTVSLVNDTLTPGNSKYYGTNGSGTRGYYDLPASGGIGGSIADQQVAFGNGTDIAGSGTFEWDNSVNKLTLTASAGALDNIIDVKDSDGGQRAYLYVDESPYADFKLFGEGAEFVELDTGPASIRVESAPMRTRILPGKVDFDLGTDGFKAIHGSTDSGVASGDFIYFEDSGSNPIFSVDIKGVMFLKPTTQPSSPVEGMVYSGTDHHSYYYNGTDWRQLDNPPTPTPTATFTPTPTATASATATNTPTPTPTPTATPTATAVSLTIDGVAQQINTDRTWNENHSVTFVVDGAGIVLGTGTKNPIKVTSGGTLQGWTMMCKPSGSVTADVLRSADGAGLPVTSIVGGSGTKPFISTNVENSSTSFTSWTSTTITAKDNLAISLSGITTATYIELTLYYK